MPTLTFELGQRPGGAGILGTTLRAYGHRLRPVMVAAGEALPPDLDDVQAIVVTDGEATLTEAAPGWLEPLQSLLRVAHGNSLPIAALGLGARVLATALGGTVAKEPLVGWNELLLTDVGRESPIYAGVPWRLGQWFDQKESILALPPGSTALASAGVGAGRRTRAFSAGVFAFAFEHRWELEQAEFAVRPTGGGPDSGEAIAASERIGRRLAESIALYLMPVDRMIAGRVKDLHY